MASSDQERRACAFWIDAADSALARLEQATATHEADAIRCAYRNLVSVSCRCPQTTALDVQQAMGRVDGQLATLGAPALLRAAFRHWPDAAEWHTGDYATLIERASKLGPQ